MNILNAHNIPILPIMESKNSQNPCFAKPKNVTMPVFQNILSEVSNQVGRMNENVKDVEMKYFKSLGEIMPQCLNQSLLPSGKTFK